MPRVQIQRNKKKMRHDLGRGVDRLRRLGALGWHFNDCSERVQIVRFCVRGAERTKTFVTAAAQAA